jgi:DNA-binding transcriptional LysR family regulator
MRLDLNLLTALDALLEEGSVLGAAQRLRLSSPAMSRTLTRIRRATGDAILVRTGRTMTPTPYALAVRADVHRLIEEAHAVLSPQREVDPASLERTFQLRWHDALIELAGPALLTAVRADAPDVRLRFLAESAVDTDDLRRGQIDLETSASEPLLPDVRHERVVEDRLVVVFRSGHPLAKGRLNVQRYASAEHVTVSRRGRLHDRVDEALQESGLRRRVVAACPTGAAALQFVRGTDLVVTVPALVGAPAIDAYGLVSRALPVAMATVPLYLAWHRRYDNDPAHAWLRRLALAALRAASVAPR